ncbi:hypothetical protein Q9J91_12815, partial [Enterococcus faecalis]|nr:hypothetical protein [Enterococcus faecalis]
FKVAQEVGAAHNLPVIDLYKAMNVYPGTDEYLQADVLHFSQVGYELLGALIVREIKGRLKPKQAYIGRTKWRIIIIQKIQN